MSAIVIKDLSNDRKLNEADMATISGGSWQLAGYDGAVLMQEPELGYEIPTAETELKQVGDFTMPQLGPICSSAGRGGSVIE